MRPSASCELWTPSERRAVNYAAAYFGRSSSCRGRNNIRPSSSLQPRSAGWFVFLLWKPHYSKISFSTHRSMGPIRHRACCINWSTSGLLKRKWVILLFKRIRKKRRVFPQVYIPCWKIEKGKTQGFSLPCRQTSKALKCPLCGKLNPVADRDLLTSKRTGGQHMERPREELYCNSSANFGWHQPPWANIYEIFSIIPSFQNALILNYVSVSHVLLWSNLFFFFFFYRFRETKIFIQNIFNFYYAFDLLTLFV